MLCEGPHPSLEVISKRLSRGLYRNVQRFLRDMQRLFVQAVKQNKGRDLRLAAITSLRDDFERAVLEINPTREVRNKEEVLMAKFSAFLDKHRLIVRDRNVQNSDREPGAEYFKVESGISDIARDVQFLSSPNMILPVFSFVRSLQTEAVKVDDEFMSIKLGLLTEENLGKLRVFVNNLLLMGARGEIDAFAMEVDGPTRPVLVIDT